MVGIHRRIPLAGVPAASINSYSWPHGLYVQTCNSPLLNDGQDCRVYKFEAACPHSACAMTVFTVSVLTVDKSDAPSLSVSTV